MDMLKQFSRMFLLLAVLTLGGQAYAMDPQAEASRSIDSIAVKQCRPGDFPEELTKLWSLEPNELCLIARSNSQKVMGGVAYCLDSPAEGYISYLGVLEGYRNQGVGNKLMQAAIADIKNRGARYITLGAFPMAADSSNKDYYLNLLMRFYERLGFRTIDEENDKNWIVKMRLDLFSEEEGGLYEII